MDDDPDVSDISGQATPTAVDGMGSEVEDAVKQDNKPEPNVVEVDPAKGQPLSKFVSYSY